MTPTKRIRYSFLAVLLPLLYLTGCSSVATRKGFYEPITAELRANNPSGAADLLEQAREENKYSEKDRLLYFLDAGLLNHYADRWEASNIKLHLADAAAEELFTKSISRSAASMVLNDNVLEYAGEDYEVLYANLISALNYLALEQPEDAFVEIRRANLKLTQLEQKYADAAAEFQRRSQDDTSAVHIDYDVDKVRFNNDAFARYLSMHLYAADGKWDDAEIDYSHLIHAFETQPHIYDFPIPDVKYRAEGGALLSVVALIGLAPEKEALSLRLRTDKDLDLVQILYDTPGGDGPEYGHFPVPIGDDYYFKFAIPQLVDRPSAVASVRVSVDGSALGELQLLENLGAVARETFSAKKSLIYIRTVIRALAKGLAAHQAKEEADTGGIVGWLKKAAIDVATDLTENPDLRSVQYLPGCIMVGDFEVAPGPHTVVLEYVGFDGHVIGRTRYEDFPVARGDFNLAEGFCIH